MPGALGEGDAVVAAVLAETNVPKVCVHPVGRDVELGHEGGELAGELGVVGVVDASEGVDGDDGARGLLAAPDHVLLVQHGDDDEGFGLGEAVGDGLGGGLHEGELLVAHRDVGVDDDGGVTGKLGHVAEVGVGAHRRAGGDDTGRRSNGANQRAAGIGNLFIRICGPTREARGRERRGAERGDHR